MSEFVHPWKLTCPPKRDHFNRKYIFQPLIFRGYVSFRGSMPCWCFHGVLTLTFDFFGVEFIHWSSGAAVCTNDLSSGPWKGARSWVKRGAGTRPHLWGACFHVYQFMSSDDWCSSKQDVYVCFLRFVKKMGSARWLISWCLTFFAFLSQVKDFCAAQKGEGTVAQPASWRLNVGPTGEAPKMFPKLLDDATKWLRHVFIVFPLKIEQHQIPKRVLWECCFGAWWYEENAIFLDFRVDQQSKPHTHLPWVSLMDTTSLGGSSLVYH